MRHDTTPLMRHRQTMRTIRLYLIVVSICSSLLLLFVAGILIASFTIRLYVIAAMLLLPWSFGLFGVAGLVRSWPDAAAKPATALRKDVVLLSFGIIGALIVGAGWLAMLLSNGNMASSITNLLISVTLVWVFVLIPIGLAIARIHESIILLREREPTDDAAMHKFYLLLVLVWLAAVTVRILEEEAIILWYSHDLVAAAYQAAEQVAKGEPYCVMGYGGVDSFEEMDQRELVYSAIRKRMSNRNGVTEPHFGITLQDEVYWWSFKRREFLPLYAFSGEQYRRCDAVGNQR